MTEPGLTDEDFRKIREAVESDAYSMAETLTDNSKRNPNFATHEVGARECALIRCMRGCGKSNREIIDATGFCEKTVRLHATGRCSHSERVPAPPTVLREGPHTEGIDHEKTRERRREWSEEKTVVPGVARRLMTDGGGYENLTPEGRQTELLEEIRDAEQRQADALERLAGIQMMMYLARDDTGKYSPEAIAEDALLHGSGGERS
jgi:hypothetical protein